MARPAAQVITSMAVTDMLTMDILEADSLWVVLYQNKPFNIRQRYWTARGEFPKYIRTTFPHKKSAENSAKKLNAQFMTTEFTVTKLI